MTPRIVVVGEPSGPAARLADLLRREGLDARVVPPAARDAAPAAPPHDLVVVGLDVPAAEALEAGTAFQERSGAKRVPIVIVGSPGGREDGIEALERGADDVVDASCEPREIVARIRAVLRRAASRGAAATLAGGRIEMDTAMHRVTVAGEVVPLTVKEYGLLEALLLAQGRVVRREELLERVWSYGRASEIESRTLDVHIRQLRRKLGPEAARIVTIRGVGFRLDVSAPV